MKARRASEFVKTLHFKRVKVAARAAFVIYLSKTLCPIPERH
jgi:hypothetical protein